MVFIAKNQALFFSELIERIRLGDQKAVTEFYKLLLPHCQKIIAKKVYSISADELNTLAHEITSEIILKKLHRFDTEVNFAPFIYRIVSNLIIDNYRKSRRSILLKKNSIELDEKTQPFSSEIEAENSELFEQKKLRLMEVIQAVLSPEKQKLIFDFYYRDMSINAIAVETGRSVPSITSDLHRIRRILRMKMDDKGKPSPGKK